MHSKGSIQERIQKLLKLNESHSAKFCSAGAQNERRLYRAKYPTHTMVFQCMDGRIHIPCATHTPLGIMQSFRNIGGKFDLGWPYLDLVISESIEYAIASGRRSLLIVTYHYSEGSEHRGCAGFNYDKPKAFDAMVRFKEQIERAWGFRHQVVCPILVGFETDKQSLILHSDDLKEQIDLSFEKDAKDSSLIKRVGQLYPKMPDEVLHDLMPIIQGNIKHCTEIQKTGRIITELEHNEYILAVGRGFDWLYVPNVAIIVGPFAPDLREPISKAAGIIKSNMSSGRIPDDGFVLLVSSAYSSEAGSSKARARERALYINELSREIIASDHKDLVDLIHPVVGMMSYDTREFKTLQI